MKNANGSFPFGLRQLGRVGRGKTYAGAQAMGGGVNLHGSGGPHTMAFGTEHEQITTFGSSQVQTIETCTTAKCDCGWTGTWSTQAEASAAARDHLMGRVEDHLVDVPFTPREVEDAKVVNGTIENLLAD